MPYLHSMHCPNCGHEAKVCTSDEDGYVLGTLFHYTCPKCNREIMFSCQGVEILDGNACPEDTIIGNLYHQLDADIQPDVSSALSLVSHQDRKLSCLQREVLIAWNFRLLSELNDEQEHNRVLIRRLDQALTNPQRQAFINWGRQLLVIRGSNKPAIQKAKEVIGITQRENFILPLLLETGTTLKNILWRDSNWSARIGLSAAVIIALGFGGQGAGIAALGGAIGVPLWIVFGSGGAFIGMLIDKLEQSLITKSK